MKQAITLIIIISIIFVSGMFEIRYLEATSSYLLADVNHVKNKVANQKYEEAMAHMKILEKSWEEVKNTWDIFVDHDEIDKIENNLVSCKALIAAKENGEALSELDLVRRNYNHVVDKKRIKFKNII